MITGDVIINFCLTLLYVFNLLSVSSCFNCLSDKPVKSLGSGGFSNCSLYQRLPHIQSPEFPEYLTLKKFKKPITSIDDTIVSEMHMAQKLNSIYLVRIYNSYLEADSHRQIYPHIIMEYCPDGSLQKLIDTYSAKHEHIPEQVLSLLSYYSYIFCYLFRYY